QPTIILTSHYMADVEALCSRIVLILKGEKRFDGSIQNFERLLGREKFVTFHFEFPIDPNEVFFRSFDPRWDDQYRRVELRIREDELRQTCIHILQNYPVTDFNT